MPPQIQNQNNPVAPPIQTTRSHTPLIILTVLLVLAGAFGTWYFLNPPPELEPENFVVRQTDQFADWKIYRNTKYGYEFKYPDNVGVVGDYDSSFIGPPTNPEEDLLLISDKENSFHFQVWDGKLSVVRYSVLGDKVLSTFKFISTSTPTIDMSNWKTYRNEEYGFEFKYSEEFDKEMKEEYQPRFSNGSVKPIPKRFFGVERYLGKNFPESVSVSVFDFNFNHDTTAINLSSDWDYVKNFVNINVNGIKVYRVNIATEGPYNHEILYIIPSGSQTITLSISAIDMEGYVFYDYSDKQLNKIKNDLEKIASSTISSFKFTK